MAVKMTCFFYQKGHLSESFTYRSKDDFFSKRLHFQITFFAKEEENVVLFHAGTAVKKSGSDEDVVTSGGRVIAVVGMAQTIHDSQKTAYQSIKKITFDGMQYRTDIAARACRYAKVGC